jgi:hypothetical protein
MVCECIQKWRFRQSFFSYQFLVIFVAMRRTLLLALFFPAVLPVLAQNMKPRDVVINEILFHPKPGGSDYVELYNRSGRIMDLSTMYLTNQSASGNYGVLKKLSDTTRFLLPGGYAVFTQTPKDLARQYVVKDAAAVIALASMPSYANTAGTVVLTDSLGAVLDAVTYNDDWQFPLLADATGVALERIDPNNASNDKSNWRSAASDAGYGTPGYQNSQYSLFQNAMLSIAITPTLFSPDGDGTDDAVAITYSVPEGGAVANVFVFDASGRRVRHLVKNAVLGSTGQFTWNGLDEQGRLLPTGHYIIYTEVFTLQGKKRQFKNAVVLARRL